MHNAPACCEQFFGFYSTHHIPPAIMKIKACYQFDIMPAK